MMLQPIEVIEQLCAGALAGNEVGRRCLLDIWEEEGKDALLEMVECIQHELTYSPRVIRLYRRGILFRRSDKTWSASMTANKGALVRGLDLLTELPDRETERDQKILGALLGFPILNPYIHGVELSR